MPSDWQELTRLTGGERILIERVRLPDRDVSIEGCFEPPPLAGLAAEDQIFVAAFVQSHGSIKAMEELYGVSYPTVKNRLRRIAARLALIRIEPAPSRSGVLDDLEAGRITVDQAVERLGG